MSRTAFKSQLYVYGSSGKEKYPGKKIDEDKRRASRTNLHSTNDIALNRLHKSKYNKMPACAVKSVSEQKEELASEIQDGRSYRFVTLKGSGILHNSFIDLSSF